MCLHLGPCSDPGTCLGYSAELVGRHQHVISFWMSQHQPFCQAMIGLRGQCQVTVSYWYIIKIGDDVFYGGSWKLLLLLYLQSYLSASWYVFVRVGLNHPTFLQWLSQCETWCVLHTLEDHLYICILYFFELGHHSSFQILDCHLECVLLIFSDKVLEFIHCLIQGLGILMSKASVLWPLCLQALFFIIIIILDYFSLPCQCSGTKNLMWVQQKQCSEWKFWCKNLSFIGFGLHMPFDPSWPNCHFCQSNQWESRILNHCSISQQRRWSLSTRSKEMITSQLGWSTAHARQGRKLVENLKLANYNVTSSTYTETR